MTLLVLLSRSAWTRVVAADFFDRVLTLAWHGSHAYLRRTSVRLHHFPLHLFRSAAHGHASALEQIRNFCERLFRFCNMRGHFEEVVDNVALNRILQSIKVQNRLALVLNQRIALAVTAQTDGRAQI